MRNNFQDCLGRVLRDEGGYCNVPGDNGGPTNYGITIYDVRAYVKKNATAQDVRNLTLDQAKSIYKSKYWDTLGCDDLPSGVDYTCFDYGVNSGLGRPKKALQRFKSLTGTKLINAINDERTAFLQAIGKGHNAQFLKGWMSRVNRVRLYSLHLAEQKPTVKATGGILASLIAGIASAYHWGIAHWPWVVGGSVLAGLITYLLIHFYHKAK